MKHRLSTTFSLVVALALLATLRNYLKIHNRLYLRYQISAQANLRRAR